MTQLQQMETFLEQPLDRELYRPKKFVKPHKPPLRVLVTDAGGKIAYNIIYKICSGSVFGPDQEVIIHLINSRGSINHKAIVIELEECGFPVFKDYVVSSNPEEAYNKVDVVIAIATYEEMPGRTISGSLVYQMIKARQLVKYVREYSHKNAKIIFTGPSTKSLTILLTSIRRIAPEMSPHRLSCVTNLDEIISKAYLGAKLKTTTDKIKNVIIWSATYPDTYNATVRMYPPDDHGALEMKDIPLSEVLKDENWLWSTFGSNIYRRVMDPDLLKNGKAVAQATIRHLKYLFGGSDNQDEIISMGVITPENEPYCVPANVGFSFPVKTKNGVWKIMEDVKYGVATQINMIRVIFNLTHPVMSSSLMKVVSFMVDYETAKKELLRYSSKYKGNFVEEVIQTKNWITRYFVTPNPAERVAVFPKEKTKSSRKSIAWDDEAAMIKKTQLSQMSAIRFSTETLDVSGKAKKDTERKVVMVET